MKIKFEVSTFITLKLCKIIQGNKMTLNELEGQRSASQDDLDNVKIKCTEFEVSTFRPK